MGIVRIEDVGHPALDPYRSLKMTNATRDAGHFVAEGVTVVERVLAGPCEVHSVLLSDRKQGFADRIPDETTVLSVPHAVARELVGFAFHSGIAAVAVRPVSASLADLNTFRPQAPGGAGSADDGRRLLLAGDRISDPENVGSLIRTASAFGASGMILGSGSADPYSRRVLRVSMGYALYLPLRRTDSLAAELQRLRDQGWELAATTLSSDSVALPECHFSEKTVLVLGNEFDGVSDEVLALCSRHVSIPMWNQTDSLNVALAAGIVCYAFRSGETSPTPEGLG